MRRNKLTAHQDQSLIAPDGINASLREDNSAFLNEGRLANETLTQPRRARLITLPGTMELIWMWLCKSHTANFYGSESQPCREELKAIMRAKQFMPPLTWKKIHLKMREALDSLHNSTQKITQRTIKGFLSVSSQFFLFWMWGKTWSNMRASSPLQWSVDTDGVLSDW